MRFIKKFVRFLKFKNVRISDVIKFHIVNSVAEDKDNPKDYGICSVPVSVEDAFQELMNFILGEGWVSALPQGASQVRAEALCDIMVRCVDIADRDYLNKLVVEYFKFHSID